LWPFSNPVQSATQAQLLYFDELLRRAKEKRDSQKPGAKRVDKKKVKAFAEAKGLVLDAD